MTRSACIVMLAAMLAVACPIASHSAEARDHIVGSWRLNLKKSTFNPGPGPKGQIRTYTHSGDVEHLTAKGVGPDGKPTLVRYSARYDGQDYPITGSSGGDQIMLKRIDDFTTQSTEKRDGKSVITARRTVSADGKTLTVVTKGTAPDGTTLDHVMVFDRR